MESDRYRLNRPVTEADWSHDPADAPITVVEYLDFQCHCCQGSYPLLEQVLEAFGNRVRYVVREFPVMSTHPRAEAAARAAEAAGKQGRFWEMYAQLFESHGRLDAADLELYARRLGLDLAKFHNDMESEAVTAKIKQDKNSGLRTGVNGTPTFFINDFRYEGAGCPVNADEFTATLLEDAAQGTGGLGATTGES